MCLANNTICICTLIEIHFVTLNCYVTWRTSHWHRFHYNFMSNPFLKPSKLITRTGLTKLWIMSHSPFFYTRSYLYILNCITSRYTVKCLSRIQPRILIMGSQLCNLYEDMLSAYQNIAHNINLNNLENIKHA